MKINLTLKIQNSKQTRAFTLVELIIVVSILGILAAIVLPEFQGHIQKAKEAAAKDNLRIFREVIERYASEHNGTPPGYLNGNTSTNAVLPVFLPQITMHTNSTGGWKSSSAGGYSYGPYLLEIPENPLNNSSVVYVVANNGSFPASEVANTGWLYHAPTKKVRLNTFGTDSEGLSYQDY